VSLCCETEQSSIQQSTVDSGAVGVAYIHTEIWTTIVTMMKLLVYL
jgi:hypothetical protein